MPQEFNTCVKSGGKVRTKTLPDGKYIRICVKDGKSYSGEVKEKKTTRREAAGTAKKKITYTPEKVERRPWEQPAQAKFKRL
jgi:hypothetical protein